MTSSAQLPELPEEGLSGLFDGTVPPGVYRTPSVGPEALLQAEAAGWYGAVLDLSGVTGRDGFLESCVAGLELPEWFRHTWDSLTDCLTDLSWWGEPAGYLILTSGWSGFESAAPEDADTAAEILGAAVGFWSVRETPLAAVLG
ncbi:barstar family protein [Streptomyces sp. JJ36]|uniref:barstar family protein n=1 Tax=Streptomyces sp. JJ36 TaxID=2736645 RepID=UPI001F48BA0E|nr:barstar family protein [Streptomyces sp. JJ36]MCF6525744.1 barstar family protein [Streptomyces sp. JJ36]